MKVSVYRRQRSRPFRFENFKSDTTHWWNIVVGNPNHHAWWAFSLFVYWR